jgi:hypothetical protein
MADEIVGEQKIGSNVVIQRMVQGTMLFAGSYIDDRNDR